MQVEPGAQCWYERQCTASSALANDVQLHPKIASKRYILQVSTCFKKQCMQDERKLLEDAGYGRVGWLPRWAKFGQCRAPVPALCVGQ